ncbi:MAG TPA: SulP family inorganic anion transporter [Bacteroidales bacterium]
MWKKYFPASEWLPLYTLKIFATDALSGITLAAYAIPVSLAYAMLAGLPPQYGVYGYLLGGLFYAMLGTGRQLAIGPTAAISLLIGTTIAGLAHGDVQRWADIASLTALIFAVMSIVAYLLRLNSVVNFISETVLLGFKAGAAIAIGLTQLPKLFGFTGGGANFSEQLKMLFYQLPETNYSILIFGILAIVALIVGEKLLPGRPVAIIIVIISTILISFTSLRYVGFKTVGLMPSGLPQLHLPSMVGQDMYKVIPLAFACFLLAYIESVSAAKTLAQKNGYEIDPHQELLALGVANIAVALGQGYPVSGGLSQSAVNDKAGAKTPMSLLVASAVIALCLLFLTGMLKNLPNVILAAIVLVAIRGLVDLKEFNHLRKIHRQDFVIALITLFGVLIFGILNGVLIAAIITLLLMIKSVSKPHIAFLGRIPGTKRYTDIGRHPDNEIIPGVLLFRVEASVLYFNVENIRNTIWSKILLSDPSLKTVIWDLSSSPYVDLAGAKLIRRLYQDLAAKGISFKIAEAYFEVRDTLRAEGLEHLFGHISRKASVSDLVDDCIKHE